MNNKYNICRICGYIDVDLPWGADGTSPSHDICPCCNVEHGYEDFTLNGIHSFRQKWIELGYPWTSRVIKKPVDFNPLLQIENIPKEYL